MRIKTTHAVHWREDGQLCRVSIDSETRKLALSEGTYTRWPSKEELRRDLRAMINLRSAFGDYLEAHHQTDDDTLPDFEPVEISCSDGPLSWAGLRRMIVGSKQEVSNNWTESAS